MVTNFHNHKIYGTIESKVPSQLWFTSPIYILMNISGLIFPETAVLLQAKKNK